MSIIQFFFISITVFVASRITLWDSSQYPLLVREDIDYEKQYDFIIVGAGTAGCVLANRLTEDPSVSVLVIEAGAKDDDPNIAIPRNYRKLVGSELDWNYRTVTQRYAFQGFSKRSSLYSIGKTVGGTSTINGMMHVRGNARDYDRWAAEGADGWSYKDVLPYFLKLEGFVGPMQGLGEEEYHNTDGPLAVSFASFVTPIVRSFLDAGKELGFDNRVDYNGASQFGFAPTQWTIKNGRRWSTADAYLYSAADRPNLDVVTGAHVREIVFDETEDEWGSKVNEDDTIPKAIGVTIYSDETYKVVSRPIIAKREVILSAGAVESPHILMISGIGPEEHLRTIGIRRMKDLPVGKNLHDHLMVPIELWMDRFSNPPETSTPQVIGSLESWFHWAFSGTGPLSVGAMEAVAFVDSDNPLTEGAEGVPDIQILFSGGIPSHEVYRTEGIDGLALNQAHGSMSFYSEAHTGFTMYSALLHPMSTGSVVLSQGSPFGPPDINPGYLSSKEDLNTLIRGVRLIQKLVNTSALAQYNATYAVESATCSFKYDSDEFWDWYIRLLAMTMSHPVGTCRMGRLTDQRSVVDTRLRVIGTSGLRVVDASVIPSIPSGNTHTPVVMIAERAADLIKEDHNLRKI